MSIIQKKLPFRKRPWFHELVIKGIHLSGILLKDSRKEQTAQFLWVYVFRKTVGEALWRLSAASCSFTFIRTSAQVHYHSAVSADNR